MNRFQLTVRKSESCWGISTLMRLGQRRQFKTSRVVLVRPDVPWSCWSQKANVGCWRAGLRGFGLIYKGSR